MGLDGEQRTSGNGRRELWWRTTPVDGGVEKRRGQLRPYGISSLSRRAPAISRESAESGSDEDTGTVASEEFRRGDGAAPNETP